MPRLNARGLRYKSRQIKKENGYPEGAMQDVTGSVYSVVSPVDKGNYYLPDFSLNVYLVLVRRD